MASRRDNAQDDGKKDYNHDKTKDVKDAGKGNHSSDDKGDKGGGKK